MNEKLEALPPPSGDGLRSGIAPEKRRLAAALQNLAVHLSPRWELPLSIAVTTLISRGLERKQKTMRKMLNTNELRFKLQVFDFQFVRNKKGVFRHHFSPLTTLISRELRRKWPKKIRLEKSKAVAKRGAKRVFSIYALRRAREAASHAPARIGRTWG
jgi:hypothetical protein